MPIIVALAGAAFAFYFFVIRARNAAHMVGDLADVAADVAGAARRFGFRRRTNVHPVEAIEDENLAAGSIAVAFLELDDYPSKDLQDTLQRELQSQLGMSITQAEEITVLGRWFVSECGGPSPAISRLSRKLYNMAGTGGVQPVMAIIQAALTANSKDLSERQTDALDDIKRAFHIK